MRPASWRISRHLTNSFGTGVALLWLPKFRPSPTDARPERTERRTHPLTQTMESFMGCSAIVVAQVSSPLRFLIADATLITDLAYAD